MNKKIQSNNKYGIVGIYYNQSMNKWLAQIRVQRKLIHLGSFVNKEDAIKARKEAEIKYFGEYAPNN
jgi:hypothetical protein